MSNYVSGRIIAISRRGAYYVELDGPPFKFKMWLKPSWIWGLGESQIKDQLGVTDEGLAAIENARKQVEEARDEDKRLS